MTKIKTAATLLDELEHLKNLLQEQGEDNRPTPQKKTMELAPLDRNDLETRLRIQLRQQARLIVRDIIDEELMRVESRMNRELNNYLEHWMNRLDTEQLVNKRGTDAPDTKVHSSRE